MDHGPCPFNRSSKCRNGFSMVLQTTWKQRRFLAMPHQGSSIFTFKPFSKRCRGKWRSRAAFWCRPMMPIIRLSAPASPSVSTWALEIKKFGTVKTSLVTHHLFVMTFMEMEAYTKVMWKGSKRCRNGVMAKVMVSPFVRTTQKKCPHKATTSVLSSFVMCVSGSHIKQQTSPGPVALSMFDRLGRFRLKILQVGLLTSVSASLHCLLKRCLPLRTWPGDAAASFHQFICFGCNSLQNWNKQIGHVELKRSMLIPWDTHLFTRRMMDLPWSCSRLLSWLLQLFRIRRR